MSNETTVCGSTRAVPMQVDAVLRDLGGKDKDGKGKFGKYGKGKG